MHLGKKYFFVVPCSYLYIFHWTTRVINSFRNFDMFLKDHSNGGRQVSLLMISLTERITPMPQLPAPSPLLVCSGMFKRGSGLSRLCWFQLTSWKPVLFESSSKLPNMFLITVTVPLGGESLSPSSKYTVFDAVSHWNLWVILYLWACHLKVQTMHYRANNIITLKSIS